MHNVCQVPLLALKGMLVTNASGIQTLDLKPSCFCKKQLENDRDAEHHDLLNSRSLDE